MILPFLLFFNQINAALVNIRDLFQKHEENLYDLLNDIVYI